MLRTIKGGHLAVFAATTVRTRLCSRPRLRSRSPRRFAPEILSSSSWATARTPTTVSIVRIRPPRSPTETRRGRIRIPYATVQRSMTRFAAYSIWGWCLDSVGRRQVRRRTLRAFGIRLVKASGFSRDQEPASARWLIFCENRRYLHVA
jgi:hypothetical protein